MFPIGNWWKNGSQRPGWLVPFEVACSCGHLARGHRQPHHQVLTCAGCHRKLFVLPISPFPPLVSAHAEKGGPQRVPAPPSGLKPWLLPLSAAGLTLVIVVVVLSLVLPRTLLNRPTGETSKGPDEAEKIAGHNSTGLRALAAGNYQLAVDEFETALGIQERNPQVLNSIDRRKLLQLHRQAALLADSLSQSLQEILRDAAGVPDREWQAVFVRRYHGKSVVFLGETRRDAAEQFRLLDYQVFVGMEKARLELKDLKLLHHLPLQDPQRLLFGARLASARREEAGEWVVRFMPDSGVLLTDPGAATACCLQPLDKELQEVLKRQSEWLADFP